MQGDGEALLLGREFSTPFSLTLAVGLTYGPAQLCPGLSATQQPAMRYAAAANVRVLSSCHETRQNTVAPESQRFLIDPRAILGLVCHRGRQPQRRLTCSLTEYVGTHALTVFYPVRR